uniref:Uncharacterized protein n=1 Tax=Solanum lycopersicum TaxID=4081 RepID=K4CDF7_SOLLC
MKITNNNVSCSRNSTSIKEMGVDISPMKTLLELFFKLSFSYEQPRSTPVDKARKLKKSESYLKAKEHLDLVLHEKNEKSEELLVACQSLKEAKKKVKELKVLRDTAKKEVEDVEFKVLEVEQEFNK